MKCNPKLDATQIISNLNYTAYAESVGVLALCVDKAKDLNGCLTYGISSANTCAVKGNNRSHISPFPHHVMIKSAK